VNQDKPLPQLHKGIALFTPGGDVVYCVDPDKQSRWHSQLCAVLQEMLGLTEPPHFLVPCYTATIDRWLDPQTRQVCTAAEAYPFVLKHQALLSALFHLPDVTWQTVVPAAGVCDPLVLATYQQQFPQLWQEHDLVVRVEPVPPGKSARVAAIETDRAEANRATPFSVDATEPTSDSALSWSPLAQPQAAEGYVLRLFVSGHSAATERILKNLHQLLETALQQPYTLKVVDIYKHPEQAEADQVAATPTLVKVYPRPMRRLVGDLDDVQKILQILASPNFEP
jgi:circadian clock protein KaiB